MDCPICLNIIKDKTPTFVCEHMFCQNCIYKWNKSCVDKNEIPTCPICRKEDSVLYLEMKMRSLENNNNNNNN